MHRDRKCAQLSQLSFRRIQSRVCCNKNFIHQVSAENKYNRRICANLLNLTSARLTVTYAAVCKSPKATVYFAYYCLSKAIA